MAVAENDLSRAGADEAAGGATTGQELMGQIALGLATQGQRRGERPYGWMTREQYEKQVLDAKHPHVK